ncbi:hypothetical protein [Nonomuraea sp. SBT364]|uniref:hypothetical protein n=1 Tax=Nonomuraea sp. SBT364 TaxID=1580530 RepID=UPI0012E25714|nr:hypothetical protein [Nonomuraea sp. SBT364]
MARRRPASVRADALRRCRTNDAPIRHIPGISARGRDAIARLERTRLRPSAAADALQAWSLFVRDPVHRLFDPRWGCGDPVCCSDPDETRAVLEAVLKVLPPADARVLRARVRELDELW